MIPPIIIIIDILAWIVVFFWLVGWVQNLLALILASVYFSENKRSSYKKIPANSAPGVSIVKPLTGSDENLEKNLESWLNIDYPVFEILFCVHSPDDTAIPIVFELMRRYPNVDAKLIVSETVPATVIFGNGTTYSRPSSCKCATPLNKSMEKTSVDPGKSNNNNNSPVYCFCSSPANNNDIVNPKIKNILPAYEMAKYGLIFLSDCYIEAERDTITHVVEHMGPRVGSVCQLYWVKDGSTFGSVVNKVLFGTHNAKSILVLYFLRFAATVGAAMLIRKEALEECGGLRAVGCYLAEDFHIGLSLAKKGWANRLSPDRLALQNPAQTHVHDIYSRLVRWKRLRHTTMPVLIFIEPLLDCFVLALVMPLAFAYLTSTIDTFPFWSFATTHVIAWFLVDYFLLTIINVQALQFSKVTFLLAWLTREMAVPFLHIVALRSRCVSWRNQLFYIRLGGLTERLQPSPTSSVITPSRQQFFAVKSFTSTPSANNADIETDGDCCIIDFVKESPITEQTPCYLTSSKAGIDNSDEKKLGGKVVANSFKTIYWQNRPQNSRTTPLQQQRQS